MHTLEFLDESIASLPIGRIELRLAARACPVLAVRVNASVEGLIAKGTYREFLNRGGKAQVSFDDGQVIQVKIIGFDRAEIEHGGAHATDAVALLQSDDNLSWFDARVAATEGIGWLVYQRLPGVHANAIEFLQEVFEGKLSLDNADEAEWDRAFVERACLWRHVSWTNADFFEHVVSLLSSQMYLAVDWCAVDSDTPLRVVTVGSPLNLNDSWTQADVCAPHYLSGERWRKRGTTFKASFEFNSAHGFFAKIPTLGFQTLAAQLQGVIEQRYEQVILVPGAVRIGSAVHYCRSVKYIWEGEHSIQAKATVVPLPRPTTFVGDQSILVHGIFQGWCSDKDGETFLSLKAAPNSGWLAVKPGMHADSELELHANVLMPGRSDSSQIQGLYVQHDSGAPMVVALPARLPPLVLGGLQHLRDELEEVSLTLGAKSIDVTAEEGLTAEGEEIAMPFGSHLAMGMDGKTFVAKKDQVNILGKGTVVKENEVILADKVKVS